jgi:hypothetical protein
MAITETKQLMQMIMKHYEKCKGIYISTLYDVPFQLKDGGTAHIEGLPDDLEDRQGAAAMMAVLAAPVIETGKEQVEIAEDVLIEVYEKFKVMMSMEKLVERGYMEWDTSKTDEHGFPAIKIIIPPEKWNITKEA